MRNEEYTHLLMAIFGMADLEDTQLIGKNEGKFVVAERFDRTLKKKNYEYMISVSTNVYINKLAEK